MVSPSNHDIKSKIITLRQAYCVTTIIFQMFLNAIEIEVGLLLNFGKEPQFKRKVLTNDYKNHKKS